MDSEQPLNFRSSEGDGTDDAGETSQETEVDKDDVNGVDDADEQCAVKMEDEGTPVQSEKDDGLKDDDDDEGSEEGGSAEDDDDDGQPQDLSLLDYARYDGPPALEETYRPPTSGKLRCDICGLSCISVNVLLVHKRSHTGERPFNCSQCGASFTQKGNLLRHIKLHSGEKPFKCPMCSYACRRRDALSGHLRTHSVEKPFKCNQCSRSYKQRSSLEEHRERCHLYMQSRCRSEREDGHTESRTQMSSERALLLDRLASNVAKRKSTMPQKFTGDGGVCLDLSFNRDHHGFMKGGPSPASPGLDHQPRNVAADGGGGGDAPPSHWPYPVPLHRNNISPMSLAGGTKVGVPLQSLPHTAQQPHLGPDAFLADGPLPVTYALGHLLADHKNGGAPPPAFPLEALRAAEGERAGAVYPCGHCRLVFLDYVMFTIHMGCHGFRDPLECNVCGHRSQDRYEFSSHFARGEHRAELK